MIASEAAKPGIDEGSGARRERLTCALVLSGIAAVVGLVGLTLMALPASADTPAQRIAARPAIVGTATVVDGDTIEIHGTRLRLFGVDAPESGQKCFDAAGRFYRCGADAAKALDKWVAGNPVTCIDKGKEKWGRTLGECRVRGASMQDWLVSNGHAMAYRNFSTEYVPAELKARKAKAGVWAGDFVAPWEWRKGQRLAGEKPTKAMREGKLAAR